MKQTSIKAAITFALGKTPATKGKVSGEAKPVMQPTTVLGQEVRAATYARPFGVNLSKARIRFEIEWFKSISIVRPASLKTNLQIARTNFGLASDPAARGNVSHNWLTNVTPFRQVGNIIN